MGLWEKANTTDGPVERGWTRLTGRTYGFEDHRAAERRYLRELEDMDITDNEAPPVPRGLSPSEQRGLIRQAKKREREIKSARTEIKRLSQQADGLDKQAEQLAKTGDRGMARKAKSQADDKRRQIKRIEKGL